ncbi:MAG: ribosome silencing factor [Janthinobacterium lividum]
MASLEANQLLRVAVDACDSRKAEDIRILALDPSESSLTDYFLICSGTNERQNVAISDEIEFRLKQEFGVYPNSIEGRRQGEWVLMDYVDFVIHIFLPEKRAYYGLEQLRKSAKNLTIEDLNSEIKAALTATRSKRSTIRKTVEEDTLDSSTATSGSASGKRPTPKEAVTVEKPLTDATKSAAREKAAKKATTAKSVAATKPVKTASAKTATATKSVRIATETPVTAAAAKKTAPAVIASKSDAPKKAAKKAPPAKAAAAKKPSTAPKNTK